ncbi:hypothetical protein HMPREF1987_01373 [Peptostreptococcaceae bacterium oral taxon 113 str. W5053]|nr:hypothetical protein HMPREF1987_01373 [Peptostreptococcaceae bacterium oral taxon 113 str. W5053]
MKSLNNKENCRIDKEKVLLYTHSKAKTENSKETSYAQRTRVGEKRVISFFEETLPSFSMEKKSTLERTSPLRNHEWRNHFLYKGGTAD